MSTIDPATQGDAAGVPRGRFGCLTPQHPDVGHPDPPSPPSPRGAHKEPAGATSKPTTTTLQARLRRSPTSPHDPRGLRRGGKGTHPRSGRRGSSSPPRGAAGAAQLPAWRGASARRLATPRRCEPCLPAARAGRGRRGGGGRRCHAAVTPTVTPLRRPEAARRAGGSSLLLPPPHTAVPADAFVKTP